jgi:hypothetical protein
MTQFCHDPFRELCEGGLNASGPFRVRALPDATAQPDAAAGVEPGERVRRVAQWDEQAGQPRA